MAVNEKQFLKEERKRRKAALRVQAAMEYISNPHMPTLSDLHSDERFQDVSIRTLERWSVTDRWVERRQEFVKQWMDEAKAKLGTKLAQDRIDELDLLQEIMDLGIQKIHDPVNIPKSWEATVKVVLDVARRQDELRQAIGDEILGARSANILSGASKYTDEELEAASKEILRLRNEQSRKALSDGTATVVDSTQEPDDEDADEDFSERATANQAE